MDDEDADDDGVIPPWLDAVCDVLRGATPTERERAVRRVYAHHPGGAGDLSDPDGAGYDFNRWLQCIEDERRLHVFDGMMRSSPIPRKRPPLRGERELRALALALESSAAPG